jgi:hypothetical protein
MDDENVDWDAFIVLSAGPEIDAATAFAASIRDECPEVPPPKSNGRPNRLLMVVLLILAIGLVLLLIL